MSNQQIHEFELSALGLTLTVITEKSGNDSISSAKSDSFHEHSLYEFFYAKTAPILLRSENGTKTIERGDVCIVCPHATHFAEQLSKTDHFCLGFSVKSTENSESAKQILSFLSSKDFNNFTPDETCLKLLSVMQPVNENNGPFCATLLLSFLLYCSGNSPQNTRDSQLGRIFRLENYLYKDLSNNLSLCEIAEELHLSTRQLSRIIKKQYGMSFREKLFSLKMQSAARLLLLGKSVSETAESVGYATSAAFMKAFKTHFGKTPAQYRKQFLRSSENVAPHS